MPSRRAIVYLALVLLIPALWLLAASYVWSAGTGQPYVPWAWWRAWQWAGANWWVNLWLALGGLLPTIFLVLICICFAQWMYMPGQFQRRMSSVRSADPAAKAEPSIRSNTDAMGHARWATDEENKRRWRSGNPVWGGVAVGEPYNPLLEQGPYEPHDKSTWGRGGKMPLLIDDGRYGSTHTMIISGSGGGKSMMAVTNLLTWKGPCVVFDPAAELGPMVRRAREAMGHRVVILDPQTSANFGVNGCGWINPDSPMSSIDVQAEVEWVCGHTPQENQGRSDSSVFFKNRGKTAVTAVLAYILSDPDLSPKLKTLNTMRSILAGSEEAIKTALTNIATSEERPDAPGARLARYARELAGSFSDMGAQDTWSGIRNSAEEDTRWLSTEAYGDLVSGDSFQMSDILDGTTDVFLSLPLKSLQDTPRVARVIIGGLLNQLYEADGNVDTRVLFEIDEAWMLDRFAPLEIARPSGRKFGVTIQMLYQSFSQIETQWGERGARSWLNDVSWYAVSGLNELKAAREISESIGDYGVIRRSESTNAGRSGARGMQIGSRSRGRNVTLSEAARRVIQASEIVRDLRSDAMLVLPRSGKAAILGQHPYYRRPEFAGMVDDNRFAKRTLKEVGNGPRYSETGRRLREKANNAPGTGTSATAGVAD